jgi:hypothetical protein
MNPRRATRVNSTSSQFGHVFFDLLIAFPKSFEWPIQLPEFEGFSGDE